MQTWQQFIISEIKDYGEGPEKIVATDYTPAELEYSGDWSFCKFSHKSVWTDTYVYTFIYDDEYDVYRCVSAKRNPAPAVSDEEPTVPAEVVVQVKIREIHETMVEFSVSGQGDTESLENFEQRCRQEAESRQASDASIEVEFTGNLDQECWTVQVQE